MAIARMKKPRPRSSMRLFRFHGGASDGGDRHQQIGSRKVFYYQVGASASVDVPSLYNPPDLPRFRVRRLPCASKQDVVVSRCAPF
jgi:hypothetical protein